MKLILAALLFLMASLARAASNTVVWTYAPADVTTFGITGFNVERSPTSCTDPALAFTPLTTVAASALSYVDNAVTPGKTYCYRVDAANPDAISVYSNTAGRRVPFDVPPAPGGLTIK